MGFPEMIPLDVYTTVVSQAGSPCGRYLCAADTYGRLAVFDLEQGGERALSLIRGDGDRPANSLATAGDFLACGTAGEIVGREWKAFLADASSTAAAAAAKKPDWTLRLPESAARGFVERADVNALHWSADDGTLYAGCGDNNVYAYDLSQGRLVRTYEGHEAYVHSVQGLNSHLISAGEDGVVKLWDTRTNKSYNEIIPHQNEKLSRPDYGKWIGAAALSGDWILCGGGPKLSLWQQRSLHLAIVPDLPDHGVHVCFFHEDRMFAAGAAPHLYQLNYAGETVVEIPVSATTVYSASLRLKPDFCFTIAGSSPYIDLCDNFNYKDRALYFGT